MPVVRELVNRISFKIDRAGKKNAEDAFNSIRNKAKIATVAFAGFAVKAVSMLVEFEKSTSTTRFFARTADEAERLFAAVDKVAKGSELTSKMEARQASASLSQTRLSISQLEKFVPLLEKISLSRGELDFAEVAEGFRELISGGNLDQFAKLIPGIKDAVEALSKTDFQKAFGDLTDARRGEIVFRHLKKQERVIDELIKKRRGDLVFSLEEMTKQGSDFTLRFANDIKGPLKESLGLVKDIIEGLNESQGLWETIGVSAQAVTGMLKLLRGKRQDPRKDPRAYILQESIKESVMQGLGIFGTIFKMKLGNSVLSSIQRPRDTTQEFYKPFQSTKYGNKQKRIRRAGGFPTYSSTTNDTVTTSPARTIVEVRGKLDLVDQSGNSKDILDQVYIWFGNLTDNVSTSNGGTTVQTIYTDNR